MDEPALNLSEVDLQSGRGWRRYRIITLVRGDRLFEYKKDLCPAKRASGSPFRIPGGYIDDQTGRIYIEHTVGELIDIAEQWKLKNRTPYNIVRQNLLEGYYYQNKVRRQN